MTAYGGILQFFMRMSGQLTPAELQALNLPSSTCLFLVHNLVSLLLVGSGTCYILHLKLGKIVLTEKRTAVLVISSLFHITATLTFLFLQIRHILFHKSYAGIRRYLQSSQEFLHPPLADRKFKTFITLFFITINTWWTTNAVQDLFLSGSKDLLYILGSVSSFISHTYTILYAFKLTLITRHVKIHFLRGNRLLFSSIKNFRHSKFCTVPKGEFEKLAKFQWDSHDFLDKVNKITGLEWSMLMFYKYVAILYRLYNATAYSALFSVDEPIVDKALSNLGQSILNVSISLILLGTGSTVTGEVRKTTEMIWNAVPKIRCTDCRRKFDIFASHVSHLPADITAKGILTLGMKTLSNMISSVATQFVILISLGNQ